jgi:hypothetical protein
MPPPAKNIENQRTQDHTGAPTVMRNESTSNQELNAGSRGLAQKLTTRRS